MRTLIAAGFLALGTGTAAAQSTHCASQTSCAEVTAFVAAVTDFRQSLSGYDHVVSTTVRFTNKTNRPLILGYVQGSGVVTDDQGIRYAMYEPGGVRAIGIVTGNTFDSKFTLQPGESSDARFEFGWRPTRGAIYGTIFTIDLGIREIDLVINNQYRLGREHSLHYSGFGAKAVAAAPPAPAPPSAVPAPAPPASRPESPAPAQPAPPPAPAPPAVVDPCDGKARCYSTGPFVAVVTSLTGSRVGRYQDHVLEAIVRFKNLSNEPLVLAYVGRTSGMVDDRGNRYAWGRAGGPDGSVAGMGMSFGTKVDPSFALRPGEARDARFTVWFRPGRAILGTSYAFDFSVEQLEILPANQLRVARQFAVSFRDLTVGGPGAGGAAASAAQGLVDLLVKKVKKP
jgi:hypothetical protein